MRSRAKHWILLPLGLLVAVAVTAPIVLPAARSLLHGRHVVTRAPPRGRSSLLEMGTQLQPSPRSSGKSYAYAAGVGSRPETANSRPVPRSRRNEERASSGPEGGTRAAGRPSASSTRTATSSSPLPTGQREPTAGLHAVRGTVFLDPRYEKIMHLIDLSITFRTEVDGVRCGRERTVRSPLREDGTYAIANLEPGDYSLQFTLSGRAFSERKGIHVAGEDVDHADFRFTREPSLSGVVATEDGAPIAGARIGVEHEPFETTDPLGEFTLYDLPAGTLSLTVTHRDFAMRTIEVEVLAEGRTPPLAVRLEPGSRLVIRAIDRSGNAIVDADMGVNGRGFAGVHRVDLSGSCEFEGLAPGTPYTIVAYRRRLAEPVPPVVLAPKERREIAVVLEE